jgi:hypothetical protein
MRQLAWLTALAVVAPASPALALRVTGPTQPRPVASLEAYDPYIHSDGRYLALNNGKGAITVYDTLRERSRTIPGCSVQDGVDERFLTKCGHVQRLYLARSKRFVPIQGAAEGDGFELLGRQWLLGWADTGADSHYAVAVYLNWHTQERVECGFPVDPDCDDFSYDIDQAGLVWRSPDLVEYEDGDRLTIKGREDGLGPRPLMLNRRVLGRVVCRVDSDCSPSLDNTFVTWVDNPLEGAAEVHAYASVFKRRRADWRIRTPRNAVVRAIHTDYGVAVWSCAPRARCNTGSRRWRAYFLPWPRAWRPRYRD